MDADEINLGFISAALPEDLRRWTFPSKIGGVPAWPEPRQLPSLSDLSCRNCDCQPFTFLLQVYAPVQDADASAFHRSLLLFGCMRCSSNFVVLRCQMPRENHLFPATAPLSEVPSLLFWSTWRKAAAASTPTTPSSCTTTEVSLFTKEGAYGEQQATEAATEAAAEATAAAATTEATAAAATTEATAAAAASTEAKEAAAAEAAESTDAAEATDTAEAAEAAEATGATEVAIDTVHACGARCAVQAGTAAGGGRGAEEASATTARVAAGRGVVEKNAPNCMSNSSGSSYCKRGGEGAYYGASLPPRGDQEGLIIGASGLHAGSFDSLNVSDNQRSSNSSSSTGGGAAGGGGCRECGSSSRSGNNSSAFILEGTSRGSENSRKSRSGGFKTLVKDLKWLQQQERLLHATCCAVCGLPGEGVGLKACQQRKQEQQCYGAEAEEAAALLDGCGSVASNKTLPPHTASTTVAAVAAAAAGGSLTAPVAAEAVEAEAETSRDQQARSPAALNSQQHERSSAGVKKSASVACVAPCHSDNLKRMLLELLEEEQQEQRTEARLQQEQHQQWGVTYADEESAAAAVETCSEHAEEKVIDLDQEEALEADLQERVCLGTTHLHHRCRVYVEQQPPELCCTLPEFELEVEEEADAQEDEDAAEDLTDRDLYRDSAASVSGCFAARDVRAAHPSPPAATTYISPRARAAGVAGAAGVTGAAGVAGAAGAAGLGTVGAGAAISAPDTSPVSVESNAAGCLVNGTSAAHVAAAAGAVAAPEALAAAREAAGDDSKENRNHSQRRGTDTGVMKKSDGGGGRACATSSESPCAFAHENELYKRYVEKEKNEPVARTPPHPPPLQGTRSDAEQRSVLGMLLQQAAEPTLQTYPSPPCRCNDLSLNFIPMINAAVEDRGGRGCCYCCSEALLDRSEEEAFEDIFKEKTSLDEQLLFFLRRCEQRSGSKGHVLRYALGGRPLYPFTQQQQQENPPACEWCGAPRQFEFQVQPQLLYALRAMTAQQHKQHCQHHQVNQQRHCQQHQQEPAGQEKRQAGEEAEEALARGRMQAKEKSCCSNRSGSTTKPQNSSNDPISTSGSDQRGGGRSNMGGSARSGGERKSSRRSLLAAAAADRLHFALLCVYTCSAHCNGRRRGAGAGQQQQEEADASTEGAGEAMLFPYMKEYVYLQRDPLYMKTAQRLPV